VKKNEKEETRGGGWGKKKNGGVSGGFHLQVGLHKGKGTRRGGRKKKKNLVRAKKNTEKELENVGEKKKTKVRLGKKKKGQGTYRGRDEEGGGGRKRNPPQNRDRGVGHCREKLKGGQLKGAHTITWELNLGAGG